MVKRAITYGIYPVVFAAAMVFALIGISREMHPVLVLGVIFLSTAAIITICERINPYYSSWNKNQDDVKVDLLHMLVSMVFLKQFLEFLFSLFLFSFAIWLANNIGFSIWPSDWHLLLQLPLAMLIIGFFEYWWHRAAHEIPFFWRFHATHHSPGRLYWVNAARFHPLDTTVSYVVTTGPLILLGVSPGLLLLVAAWVNVHGMFQHSNIHLKLGPLNWIFSMAELHRWHHSKKLEEANANYGNNIIFWDIVFGTRYFPKERKPAENVGLSGMDNFPKDYVGQILSPFKWKEIEQGQAEDKKVHNPLLQD